MSKEPEAPIRISTHFPRSDPESRGTKGVYVMVPDSELIRLLWVPPSSSSGSFVPRLKPNAIVPR